MRLCQVRSLNDPRAKTDPLLEQEPLEEMLTSDRCCFKRVDNVVLLSMQG